MLRRERVHRWNVLQADKGPKLLGSARQEIPVRLHDSPGIFEIPEDWTGIDHVHRMSLEQEARDDAEIAAAAAQAPVEVSVLRLAGGDNATVGEHDLRLQQIVDGEAMLAGEVSGAAAKREAGDTGRRDNAGRHGEPVDMRGVVDIALRAAGTGANGARGGIH